MKIGNTARWSLFVVLTTFVSANAWLLTAGYLRREAGEAPTSILPEDLSLFVVLLIAVVVMVVSWFLSRALFKILITSQAPLDGALNASYALCGYLILTFFSLTLLGTGFWILIPVLYAVLLIWVVQILWTVAGSLYAAAAGVVVSLTAVAAWFINNANNA